MANRGGTIAYHSLSGYTRRAAERLAARTGGDLFEWTADRYGTPVLGYMHAGLDALRGIRPPGTTPLPDLSGRDWLVLAGPVWVGRPSAPLASLIEATRGCRCPVSILLTSGDAKSPTKAFAICDGLRGKPFEHHLHIPNKIDGTPEMDRRIDRLAGELGAALSEVAG